MNSGVKYFFRNSSIHGFKYLVTDDEPRWKKIFARFFWSFFIGISILLMSSILITTLNEFNTKATSINLDTSYRDWDNPFPAVSICMTKGPSTSQIKEYMINYWDARSMGIESRTVRYFRSIHSMTFMNYQDPLNGVNIKNCLEMNETCGIDFDIVKNDLMPKTCKDFMVSLKFLGEEVPNCEKIFKLHRTAFGNCFIANSLYSNGKSLTNFRQLPLRYSNLGYSERSLEIEYKDFPFVTYKLFVHTPEERPDWRFEGYGLKSINGYSYLAFKTTEMMNQGDVTGESISARQCRFPDEFFVGTKVPYSISRCHSYERVVRELTNCNCTLPIGNLPKDIPICDLTKFECARQAHDIPVPLKDEQTNNCTMPSCLAMEIVHIGTVEKTLDNASNVVIIDILNKPTLRYIRRVGITKLDMIGKDFTNDNQFYIS